MDARAASEVWAHALARALDSDARLAEAEAEGQGAGPRPGGPEGELLGLGPEGGAVAWRSRAYRDGQRASPGALPPQGSQGAGAEAQWRAEGMGRRGAALADLIALARHTTASPHLFSFFFTETPPRPTPQPT